MRKSMLAAVAALSMMTASGGAMAQSAASLSLASHLPADAGTSEANEMRGGFIIPAVVILALAALVYVLTKDGDSTSP